jgi:hypothetical protein
MSSFKIEDIKLSSHSFKAPGQIGTLAMACQNPCPFYLSFLFLFSPLFIWPYYLEHKNLGSRQVNDILAISGAELWGGIWIKKAVKKLVFFVCQF